MKKLYTLFFAFLGIILLTLPACEFTKPDPVPPPPMNIITSDATGTLGELTVDIYYRDGNRTYAAPDFIDVELYASAYDLDHGLPVYTTYTFNHNPTIYFGFLDPDNEYYVLAYGRIDYADFEAAKRVMIVAGQHTRTELVMEELPPVQ